MAINFTLIGDGQIAKYHRKAIEHVGGEIICVIDPKYDLCFNEDASRWVGKISQINLLQTDYFVISSPSDQHYSQIKFLLHNAPAMSQIICEKPAFLPWQPIIDDDRLNIVLQLRYLEGLPDRADNVVAHFVRDDTYFASWKGDPKKTGGLFYNLFIHYIDLANILNANFEGQVRTSGKQSRQILKNYRPENLEFINKPDDPRREELEKNRENYQTPIGAYRYNPETESYWMDYDDQSNIDRGTWEVDIDILNVDYQKCYNRLYEDILAGGGIKPVDLFYLNWALQRNSEIFGYGKNGIGRTIKVGKELL